jgi:anti-sigma B factor antagonist
MLDIGLTLIAERVRSNLVCDGSGRSSTVTPVSVVPVMVDQLDTITPALQLNAPTVVATVSCPQSDTALCRVTGTVGLITAPALASRLIEAVHEGRPHIVIDLSAVAVLDSTGLHAALDILDSYNIDGHLAIVIDSRSEALTRPEINELSEIVDIHHDLASALRTCARASITTGGRHRAIA